METRAQLERAGFDFVDHAGTAAEVMETQVRMEASGVEFEFRMFVEDCFGFPIHILAAKRVSLTTKQKLEAESK